MTEGASPAGAEMAVLLIYQPAGVLESTLFTLSYFLRNGVSPVVVSNTPLGDTDRDRLAALAHLVIERPNVGYDFGGYREGILTLLERGLALQALYVLNDSIWFPLRADCDAIARCREASADVLGLLMSHTKSGRRCEYIESYFYRFSQRVLADGAFRHYWQEMPLLNDKHAVVRRYERCLSRHFSRRGFSTASLTHWREMTDHLLTMEDEGELSRVFDYQCRISEKDCEYIQPLLRQGRTGSDVRDALREAIRRRRIFVTLVLVHPTLILKMNVPFLKKKVPLQRAELRALGLWNSFDAVLRQEMEGLDPPSRS